MSEWLVGRQEIADYAGVSVWTVTAMQKAGLQASGGKVKGSPPRTKKNWVDEFFEKNPDFVASDYNRPRIRSI
tara:strand:- start:10513 stop:10731 length:219 start_codon:yes stop_codon:yes gene_type:complete